MTDTLVWVSVGTRASTSGSIVYHMVHGCTLRKGSKGRIPTVLAAAERAGLTPCRSCHA